MLKLEQLRCFVVAVDKGSLVEASRVLNMSPSAVAYNVETLEKLLDTALLIRRPASGVSVTMDGARLLERARPFVQEAIEMEQLFPARGRSLEGELVIGCQEGLSWSLIPLAVERLKRKHPHLAVTQKTVFMEEGNNPITNAAVDLLVTFVLETTDDAAIDTEVLCKPKPYALMRAAHPLAELGRSISMEELAQFPQLFIQDGPALELFRAMFQDKGLSPPYSVGSNTSAGAQAVVGRCDSVYLRYVKSAQNISPLGDALAFVPVSDIERGAYLVASCARRKYGGRQAKIESFIFECRALFADGTLRDHLIY